MVPFCAPNQPLNPPAICTTEARGRENEEEGCHIKKIQDGSVNLWRMINMVCGVIEFKISALFAEFMKKS